MAISNLNRTGARMNKLGESDPQHREHAISREEAARNAGPSKRQMITALRIAAIPKPIFEILVEGDSPPTISQLAELGRVFEKIHRTKEN